MKFQVPEIFVGVLLAIAVFAMGVTFESSRHRSSNQAVDKTAANIQKAHKPEPFTMDWLTEDGTVFFTAALVFVAGIQAGLFVWQLRYMRQGIQDAATAANAAATSADALVASERARFFIVIDHCNLSHLVGLFQQSGRVRPGENVSVKFFFKNYGKTPGILKERVVNSVIAEELPETLALPLSVKNFRETMIGGGNSTDFEFFGPTDLPTNEQLAAIMRNNKRFWFYGRLYYNDVFGDPQVHCFYFRSRSNAAGDQCVLEPLEPEGHKKST
jgi:hypothetical protein